MMNGARSHCIFRRAVARIACLNPRNGSWRIFMIEASTATKSRSEMAKRAKLSYASGQLEILCKCLLCLPRFCPYLPPIWISADLNLRLETISLAMSRLLTNLIFCDSDSDSILIYCFIDSVIFCYILSYSVWNLDSPWSTSDRPRLTERPTFTAGRIPSHGVMQYSYSMLPKPVLCLSLHIRRSLRVLCIDFTQTACTNLSKAL